jgi:pimeloyl-ACP methyl ester carboxylesterase
VTALRVEDTLIDAPGGRLFARVWGNLDRPAAAAPIVLLHDSLGSVELWRDFPARLAGETQRAVVAYDRLGFGKSDPHCGALAADFIRREGSSNLPALYEALAIQRAVLFGHSVGGGMAVVAAADRPELCVAVITEAAQTFVEERTLAGIRAAQAAFAAPGQMERLARYHGEKAPWVLKAWTETWLDPHFASWSLDDALRRVRCPMLAMHGDRDEYGSRWHPERIAALAGGPSRVVVFEACGHLPHREKPDEVLRAVREFLDSLVGASG